MFGRDGDAKRRRRVERRVRQALPPRSPPPHNAADPSPLISPPALVLVGLYEEPEKPSKAHVLEYVQKHLNPETSNADIQALKQENAELKQKNQQVGLGRARGIYPR